MWVQVMQAWWGTSLPFVLLWHELRVRAAKMHTRRHLSEEYNDRDMHSRTRTLLLDPYLLAGIDIDDLYFQV